MTDWVGIFAAFLTTACWFPQIERSLRRGTASDFAWSYLLLDGMGLALWLVYGLLRRDMVVLLSDALVLGGIVMLSTVKLRSRRFEFGHFELEVPLGVDPAAALESLGQIGPQLATDLHRVGITDSVSLRSVGVDEANRRLVDAGLQTGTHSRRAIQGALGEASVEGSFGVARLLGQGLSEPDDPEEGAGAVAVDGSSLEGSSSSGSDPLTAVNQADDAPLSAV